MAQAQELSQDTINNFVRAAHGDIGKLRDIAASHRSVLEATASWKETALEAAAHSANKEMVEFLLSNGAQPDVFSAIVLEQVDDVATYLDRNPGLARAFGAHGIPILFFAAAVGNERIAEILLAHGADVNAGMGGNTALHGAAFFGKLEITQWLLGHGADVNAKDYNGKTPFAIATDRGHGRVADLLRGRA
ncbi:MAG TPA: ankyrin repeat domain-containing protein [bacterium]|nr:ankyrin repeat domain-containing protein [bacterium]